MNTPNNQLRQDTEKRIREALFFYTAQEREPTVGEICERAQINRSTFYRHYLDIYDLMEKTEQEIQKGLLASLPKPTDAPGLPFSAAAILPFVRYVGENRHFYKTYLRAHPGEPMEESFQSVWEKRLKPMFLSRGVENERHMLYYFHFVKAGFTTVLRLWLENGCAESPEEIAELLERILPR